MDNFIQKPYINQYTLIHTASIGSTGTPQEVKPGYHNFEALNNVCVIVVMQLPLLEQSVYICISYSSASMYMHARTELGIILLQWLVSTMSHTLRFQL